MNEARIRQILNRDRVWAAYALADLQPAFAPYCRWHVTSSAAGEGLVLIFSGLNPPIIITMGAETAVRSALQEMELPERIFLSIPLAHYPLFNELYDFSDKEHPMQRMLFSDPIRIASTPLPRVTKLSSADAERLKALYAHGGRFTPGYFDPYQLDDGVYFGLVSEIAGEEGALLAAGGTHILDRSEQIAAIGNMYTRPDQRGRGHGSTILQSIVATLLTEGFITIFLNVDQQNKTAQQIYHRFGFTDYCVFMEGDGVRRT